MYPLLSVFCEYQENSDNVFQTNQEQAKCINGSNSFPEGDRGVLNTDLNRGCKGFNDSKGNEYRTYYQERQEQGNSLLFKLSVKLPVKLPVKFLSSSSSSFGSSFTFSFGSILGDLKRCCDDRRQRQRRQRHILAKLDLSFSNPRVRFFHEPKMPETGYAQKLSSKMGYAQLEGRAMPTIYA